MSRSLQSPPAAAPQPLRLLQLRLLPLCLLLLSQLLTSCGERTADASTPPAPDWLVERLYFGLAAPQGPVTAQDFDAFLREVVTPRFPDGLTRYQAQGQWRGPDGTLVREASVVIEIACTDTATHEQAIADIRQAYCQRFHQQSVMRTRQPVHADF